MPVAIFSVCSLIQFSPGDVRKQNCEIKVVDEKKMNVGKDEYKNFLQFS